jgi:hypothetical protein
VQRRINEDAYCKEEKTDIYLKKNKADESESESDEGDE